MNSSLTIKIDTSEIIKEIEGLEEMVHYYHCIPILIEGIKSICMNHLEVEFLTGGINNEIRKGMYEHKTTHTFRRG